MAKAPLKRRALSLLEVVLSVTILAGALTLLVGLLPSASLNSRMARERVLAGGLAQDMLESIDKGNLAALMGGPLTPLTREGTEFLRKLELNPFPPPSQAVRVRAVVSWRHAKQDRSVFREQVLSMVPR